MTTRRTHALLVAFSAVAYVGPPVLYRGAGLALVTRYRQALDWEAS